MRDLRVALVVAVILIAGCSSAGVPGADDTLDQVEKAKSVALEVELRQIAVAEEAYFAQNDTYTTDLSLLSYTASEDVAVTIRSADTTTFCAEATDGNATLRLSKESVTAEEGPC